MSMSDLDMDPDTLERVTQQLLHDFEGDAARIAEFEGGPVIIVNSTGSGQMWFVVADERPQHAPGHWFEVAGAMATHVVSPDELCQGCGDWTGTEFYTSPSCPVHGVQRSEGLV